MPTRIVSGISLICNTPGVCCIKECKRKVLAHDMCATHWRAIIMFGSPLRRQVVQYHGLTNEERFFKWVQKTNTCWLWQGALSPKGYGQFAVDRKRVGASRFSWELHHGPVPEGMHVCHKCDVRACIRVEHLFLGTHEDNMLDMMRKGRQANAILNANQVKLIRLDPRKHEDIAKDYGVIRQTISLLKAGKTWPHVTGKVVHHEPEPRYGEKNSAVKLTVEEAMIIKGSNERVAALASRFGVHRQTIRNIQQGRTWKNLEPGPERKVRRSPVLLTEADVRAILASPERSYVLAERYKVARSAITNIRKRRSWRHID